MPELQPILIAGLTGFLSGVLLSIPVGPVNLTILNEGARRGFKWGLLIGFGASTMEVIYCTIAFTGFSSLFDNRVIKASMEVFSFFFMLFLGIKFLLPQNITAPQRLAAATDRIEHRIEEKLHPHSAFMIGFVRTMANPGVLLFWIILAAALIFHGFVAPEWPAKLACIAGVALGTNFWFATISWAVSRGHGLYRATTLRRMEFFSGVGLLGYGLFLGVRIIWQLAKHKL